MLHTIFMILPDNPPRQLSVVSSGNKQEPIVPGKL
jgi:hypothetical protein